MNEKIYCFTASGKPLTDDLADFLFISGCKMLENERRNFRICHDDYTGIIKTNFDFGVLGATTGVVFDAKVETVGGINNVKFLVTDSDYQEARRCGASWVRMKQQPIRSNKIPQPSQN